MISIETTRLIIREIKEEDYPFLLDIYNCEENMKYISTGKYNWTLAELQEKYSRINDGQNGYGLFVIEKKQSKAIIGEAGLFDLPQNPETLELGYIIDNEYWRNGFGYEVCQALIKCAFERLGVTKVIARMYADNIGSVSLSEKIGMKKVETGYTSGGRMFYRYELDI